MFFDPPFEGQFRAGRCLDSRILDECLEWLTKVAVASMPRLIPRQVEKGASRFLRDNEGGGPCLEAAHGRLIWGGSKIKT